MIFLTIFQEENGAFLVPWDCHGPDEAPSNSSCVATVVKPHTGQSKGLYIKIVHELRSFLKEPEETSMDDNPTAVKLDQGGNQAPQGRGRRCLPKALGFITGDMKEFANWLKGIYATLEKWRWGRWFAGSSTKIFSYTPLSSTAFLSIFFKTFYLLTWDFLPFFLFLMETVVLFMSEEDT